MSKFLPVFCLAAAMGAAAVYVVAEPVSRPNAELTPGAVAVDIDIYEMCTPGYSQAHRLPFGEAGERERYVRVMNAYGIPRASWRSYQMDHLVPLCLGGADVEANLWPELWPQARDKDKIEAKACRQVCAGDRGLVDAQRWFQSWGR